MTDEIDQLKAEEKERMEPNQWAWAEEERYERITIDDLKEEESELITVSGTEGGRMRPQPEDSWGWGRLGIIVAFLVGFSAFADANVIGLLGRYWWLIFIVIAWRNQKFRVTSWPAFTLAFFAWSILVGGFGFAPLLVMGGFGLIALLLSRRDRF